MKNMLLSYYVSIESVGHQIFTHVGASVKNIIIVIGTHNQILTR